MKNVFKLLTLFCLFSLLLACNSKDDEAVKPQPAPQPVAVEKATVIYLVRHAEKGTNNPVDPDLSAAGQARAIALKDTLRKVEFSSIYSTNYKRTLQTIAPTASVNGLPPVIYDPLAPHGLDSLVTRILKANLYKTVLIVGHSNTVLETIEAFRAVRPIPVINESDYNYLFKVTLKENKAPQVEVKRYGN